MYSVTSEGQTRAVKARYADYAAIRFVLDHTDRDLRDGSELAVVVYPIGVTRQVNVYTVKYDGQKVVAV
jgi:hypothetical protein